MEKGEDGLQIASAAAPFTVSVTSSTTTATALQPPSSNFAPVNLVSSSHSSDPELNDALNILLSDSGNKCAGEVSDEMPPYLFDLPSFLFPVGSLPSSADMLSQGLTQTSSVEGRTDSLQYSTSTAPSSLDGLRVLPTSNSPNSSAVPLSMTSSPGGLCAVSSGNSTAQDNETPNMDCFFDLLSLIPFPPSTDLPSEEVQGRDTLQQLPASTSLSTASESLPTLSAVEQSSTTATTASSQPPTSNFAPRLSSDEISPYLFDLPSFLFPLPQTSDLALPSQYGVLSQSALECQPVDLLHPPTSLTQFRDQGALNSEDSNWEDSNWEKMTPELEYFLDLISLIPLAPSTDLPSQGISQPTGMEQGISQPPTGMEQGASQPTGMEQGATGMEQGISQPTGMEQGATGMEQGISQPPTGMEQGVSQPTGMEQGVSQPPTGMEQGISQPPTGMEQGVSQPTGMEQGVSQPTGMEQGISQPTGMEQGVSQPTTREQGTSTDQGVPECMSVEQNMQGPSTTSQHLLPIGDQLSHLQREKSIPSPSQFSPSGTCTPADSVSNHSASTDQSTAGSLPPSPQSDNFHSVRTEEYSAETPSQAKGVQPLSKEKRTLSAAQKLQQRKVNKVSALHYRSRKKDKESCLEVRRKELEDTNAQLKEQVSALTAEIERLRQNTKNTKTCSFFLHSTCNK